MKNDRSFLPIGVFDSGIGGISVLAEMMRILPNEKFIYLADAGNAPYGTKSSEQVRAVSLKAARTLSAKRIKGMVIACNTATSAGINDIRAEMDFPVIGMEPALKPAVAANNSGPIMVMATPLTLKADKFNDLRMKFNQEAAIVPVPCPGLVELIESEANPEDIKKYLRLIFSRTELSDPKAMVLGCTHYCFIRQEISEVLGPGVVIFDGNKGTAKHLVRTLKADHLLAVTGKKKEPPEVEIMATGDSELIIPLCRRFLTKAQGMMGI